MNLNEELESIDKLYKYLPSKTLKKYLQLRAVIKDAKEKGHPFSQGQIDQIKKDIDENDP